MNCRNPEKETDTFQKVVDALSSKSFYPHPVSEIKVIETHISLVFLTGDYAYKLKKPVNFGFLDFTQIQQRVDFCHKELKLNQRTAKALYLDVKPLYLHQGHVSWQPNTSERTDHHADMVDCVVQMAQFDPQKVLGNYLSNPSQTLSDKQIQALAEQVAHLHQNADKVRPEQRFGQPHILLKPMTDNFPTLKKFLKSSAEFKQSLHTLQQIEDWTLSTFKILTPTLQARKAQGFIRCCHGDLHLDNIALIDDQPTLFDAIEFNDDFSHIDVISDLAFLLVDLQKRKASSLAKQVLSIYLHFTQDYQSLKLLRFYQVYRAMVRAKISALQATQTQIDSQKHQALTQKTLEYLQLAQSLQTLEQPPKLILVQGISGSGKSVFAKQLLEYLEGITLSSDRTRKQLFGISPVTRVTNIQRRQLYSQTMSQRTYQTLLENAKMTLQAGLSVIVDATFLKQAHRQKFYDLARSQTIDYYLFYIEISPQLAKQSIMARQSANQDPSDADIDIMLNQLDHLETPTPNENALQLTAQQIRQQFPKEKVKNFLTKPLP